MTLHLELVTAEAADALVVIGNRPGRPLPAVQPDPKEKRETVEAEAYAIEAPAGTWGY